VEKEGIVNSLKIYNSYDEANKTLENLNSVFKLIHVDESIKYIFPKQPFTTSLLLYESKVNFGFSIQKTTSIIQKLYEGVQLNIENKKKRISLITYPRTDSSRINKSFSFQIFSLISEKWGKELFKLPKINPSKRRNVQDAHEAIRPTYLKYKPDELKNYDLEEDFIKVYEMIYNNTITAFMRPIKYCDKIYYYSNDKRYFGIEEKVLIEKGFLTLGYGNFSKYGLVDNSQFENFTNIEINKDSLNVEKNEDDAPKRYSEGSLIKKLEVLGIGRPSTYNTFTRIILKRRYSLLDKKSTFIPTEMGFKVNDWLQENFSSIINENYTAFLEEQLDEISNGKNTYLNFINGFWKDFSERYKLAGGE
ncbi:MAG TPA: DNA topoisomerase, partial [Mycoplasmatales bacterium]|nr:DNA topoisomerase [Mycoplasmatales bacterium]